MATFAESADVPSPFVMWVEAVIRLKQGVKRTRKAGEVSNLVEGPKGPLRRHVKSVRLQTAKIP